MGKKRKFNVYKIKKENIQALRNELSDKGLVVIGSQEIDDHKLELFFAKKENEGSVWWVEQYKNLFEDLNSEQYMRSNLYGVVLIENKEYTYAFSYGNSYFYLQKHCDYNFGLDLAERLVDSTGVNSKVSKFFNINKSKEIVVYNNNLNLEFDNGEATFYVQAKPLDTSIFGNSVKFGYSASFQLDLNANLIVEFIKNIELYLNKEAQFKVPRVKVLNEKIDNLLISDLNLDLYNKLKSGDNNIRLEYLGIVGTTIITEDNVDYHIYIGNTKKEKVDILNVESVKEYIIKYSITLDKLRKIRVKFQSESFNTFSRKLIEIIDYTIEKDEKYYCIVNGKWAEFNESYIAYLKENLDKISNEIEYNEEYNLILSKIEQLRQICTEKLNYNEYLYNKYYMSKYGFKCYDRNFIKYGAVNVELGDLYKDNTLYHVKIGENGKLIYAIDQSILSIKALKDPSKKIEIDNKFGHETIKNIGLILIFDSKTIIKNEKINFNNINSIIFKMKIMDWYNSVKANNFTPKLLVNFKI